MGASKPTPKPRAPKKSKTAPLPKDDNVSAMQAEIARLQAALEDANKQVPTGGGEAPPVATTKTARSALSKMRSQGTPVAKMNTPGSKATAPQTNLKTSTATPAPGTPISKHAKPNSATTIDNNGSNANSNHNPSDHPPSRCLKNVQAVIPLTKDPKTRKWLRPKGGHNKNWNLFVDYLSKLSGILKEDYNSMMAAQQVQLDPNLSDFHHQDSGRLCDACHIVAGKHPVLKKYDRYWAVQVLLCQALKNWCAENASTAKELEVCAAAKAAAKQQAVASATPAASKKRPPRNGENNNGRAPPKKKKTTTTAATDNACSRPRAVLSKTTSKPAAVAPAAAGARAASSKIASKPAAVAPAAAGAAPRSKPTKTAAGAVNIAAVASTSSSSNAAGAGANSLSKKARGKRCAVEDPDADEDVDAGADSAIEFELAADPEADAEDTNDANNGEHNGKGGEGKGSKDSKGADE